LVPLDAELSLDSMDPLSEKAESLSGLSILAVAAATFLPLASFSPAAGCCSAFDAVAPPPTQFSVGISALSGTRKQISGHKGVTYRMCQQTFSGR
jgi:hypothetical protein